MTVLLRFQVLGKTVSINESDNTIEIEIFDSNSSQQYQAIRNYLLEEGILDEILAGNTKFPETTAETLLQANTRKQ